MTPAPKNEAEMGGEGWPPRVWVKIDKAWMEHPELRWCPAWNRDPLVVNYVRGEYLSLAESQAQVAAARAEGRIEALKEEEDYWLDQCEMCLDTDQNPQWCRGEFTRLKNKIESESKAARAVDGGGG